MYISETEIINMALAYLGQEPISSARQSDERARLCNLFYAQTRRELLRKHDFTFATNTVPLAQLGAPELKADKRWKYHYQYESKFIFLKKVFSLEDPHERPVPYELKATQENGTVIACNIPRAGAKCVKDQTDPCTFDPAFVKLLACALAVELAVPLTADASLLQAAQQRYSMALEEARLANKRETREFAQQRSEVLEAMGL